MSSGNVGSGWGDLGHKLDLRETVVKETVLNLLDALDEFPAWAVKRRGIAKATAEGAYAQGAKWFVEMIREQMKATLG